MRSCYRSLVYILILATVRGQAFAQDIVDLSRGTIPSTIAPSVQRVFCGLGSIVPKRSIGAYRPSMSGTWATVPRTSDTLILFASVGLTAIDRTVPEAQSVARFTGRESVTGAVVDLERWFGFWIRMDALRDDPTGPREDTVVTRTASGIHVEPNPFASSTRIRFPKQNHGFVSISVHSIDGRRVRELPIEGDDGTTISCSWDGRNDAGEMQASGTYAVRLIEYRVGYRSPFVYSAFMVKL